MENRGSQRHVQHGLAHPWHVDTGRYESLDLKPEAHALASGSSAQAVWVWVVCLLIGVCTALMAQLINLMVENVAGTKFLTTASLLSSHGAAVSFLFFVCVNTVLASCAATVTALYAPAAAGSGIGDVKAYLNGVDVPGLLQARTLAAKVVGSAASVAAGLAVGKEGPFVHIGASLGALLGQGGTQRRHLQWACFAQLRNDRARRDFVTCGASCGVAAAFRAPIGGLLFALEELATHWRPQLTWRSFAANAACVVTLRTVMRYCSGTADGPRRCGLFSPASLFLFDSSPLTGGQEEVRLVELLPMVLLAASGGVLGATFTAASQVLCTWRRDVFGTRRPLAQVAEAAALALLTSVVCFALPLAVRCTPCPRHLGDCPRSAAHPTGNFVGFGCSQPGHYNDLATLLFNTPEAAIRNLFSSQTAGEYSASSLVAFTVLFYVLSLLTYGASLPSGLFVPSALCGAAYGRLVGAALVARVPSAQGIQEGTYALLGAAAFLGGATRMTVSLCVILLELTANLWLLPSVMAVLLLAKACGDALTASLYDTHNAVKRLPLLPQEPPAVGPTATAGRLVAHQGGAPVTLPEAPSVETLVRVLSSCSHNGFPVLGDDGRLRGLVLRSTVLALLRARAMRRPADDANGDAAAAADTSLLMDVSKWASTPGPALHDVVAGLAPEEQRMRVDLTPWMDAAPHCVTHDAPLDQVHATFRLLGLRHAVVLPPPPSRGGVYGVLTRKDLLPSVVQFRLRASTRGSEHAMSVELPSRQGPSADVEAPAADHVIPPAAPRGVRNRSGA